MLIQRKCKCMLTMICKPQLLYEVCKPVITVMDKNCTNILKRNINKTTSIVINFMHLNIDYVSNIVNTHETYDPFVKL